MKAIAVSVGQKFNRWTILRELPSAKGQRRVVCRCDCGTERRLILGSVRAGQTQSCGCLRAAAATKHGLHKSQEYSTWSHMWQRCTNKRNPRWSDYGGRGISVASEWKTFERFIADMGKRPTPQHSLDRINNDGPYSAGNCRWATRSEQRRNKRDTYWQRVACFVAAHNGHSRSTFDGWIKMKLTDREIAQHIARVYYPQESHV